MAARVRRRACDAARVGAHTARFTMIAGNRNNRTASRSSPELLRVPRTISIVASAASWPRA